MSENKDRTSRIAERIKRDREPGTFERYNNDILHYLREKFPDEPESSICEAAAFISNRTVIVVNDFVIENNREWTRTIERIKRRLRDE